MSTVDISPLSDVNASNSVQLHTLPLTPKERTIKLVHALALTIFSAGFALLFDSVRKMYKEFWTGKKVEIMNLAAPKPASAPEKAKPLETAMDFETIKSETERLTFNYIPCPNSRFSDVGCPDETALQIEGQAIHANWVRMPDGNTYIASQAPVFQDFGRFWQAAFKHEGFVVDLTTSRDHIRPYAPTATDRKEFYENCTVEHCSSEKLQEHFILHTYKVKVDQEVRDVQRLHFDAWKDYDVTCMETLNRLVELIDEQMTKGKTPIIHCRAGIGRTGTLISVLTIRNLQKQRKITQENVDDRLKEVVLTGRQCRGPAFVQNSKQFNTVKASVTT